MTLKRSVVATAVFAAVLASEAMASVQYRIAPDAFAPLSGPVAAGAKVKIVGIPVDGKPETLELERFEVFAKGAEIRVVGANDEILRQLEPPPMRLYRGAIAGHPDSVAFVSVSPLRVEGVIFRGDRRFGIGSRRRTHRQITREGDGVDLFIQEAEVVDDVPVSGTGFECDLERSGISRKPTLSSVVHDLTPRADGALSTASARWVINIAIETDYELFVNAGSSSTNVNTFVTNLIGAMSTIYNRELTAEVQISYLGIHTSTSDPFAVTPGTTGTWNGASVALETVHALLEFGDRWHNTPPSALPRSTTALLSGKNLRRAGVAWLDVLCQGDFFFDPNAMCSGSPCYSDPYKNHYGGRYSYNGGITEFPVPDPDADAPTYTVPASNYWPLLELAHETGHNVFSGHTHCRSLSAADQLAYGRAFVDGCYNGEAGSGCYSGTQGAPLEKGTIMSYCHLLGAANSRFIFGKTGEASYVMSDELKAAIQAVTPDLSAIAAPSSLGSGASGTASVTNVAGLTYLWTVTNGTINSGQGTNSINFTATTHPTTVRVKATNSAGCSITDARDVTVTSAYNPPTNVVATAVTATSVSISWTAPTGTAPVQYDIYRSSDGINYGQINFVGHPTNVYVDATAGANAAYLYKVRSAASGGSSESADSNRDLATTVIFTDDPLTPQSTPVKATHLTQLRTAVNAVRTLAGIGAGTYTDPTITAGTTPAKAVHINDLRTALDAARSALSLSALAYGETITSAATTMKTSHMTELRTGVK